MPFTTDIIDVHTRNPLGANSGDADNDVPVTIISGLSNPAHQRTLPQLLLYSETGLRIFDELTTQATEYYLSGAEEDILKSHGDEIVRAMHSRGLIEGESVVELGAGQVISPLSSPSVPRTLANRAHRSLHVEMRYRINRCMLVSTRAP